MGQKLTPRKLSERRRKSHKQSSVAAEFQRALVYHQAGRLEEAERAYRELLSREPGHADALHYVGLVVHQRGRVGEGVEWLRRALEARGDDAGCWNNLGNMLRELGRLEEARAAYVEALGHAPGHVNARYHLGVTFEDLGSYGEAVGCYRQVLETQPEDVEVWHSLGTALQRLGELEEAEGAFRKVLGWAPGDASAWYNLGNVLKGGERLEDAVGAYREAIAARPDYAQAHNNLGAVLRLLGKTDEAIAALREALRLRPDNTGTHKALASALFESNDLRSAAKTFEDALRVDPEDVVSVISLGNIHILQESYATAQELFERATELDPSNVVAHSSLGRVLLQRFDPSEAESQCRMAIELDPGFADSYAHLGAALKQQHRGAEAIAAYEKAVELDPLYAEAYCNVGLTYMDEGDLARARDAYNKALELKPELDEARVNLAMTKRFTPADREQIEALEAVLTRENLRDASRANTHYALGKVYDDCGEYDKAFPHFERANEIEARRHRFNRERHVIALQKVKDHFPAVLFERFAGSGSTSEVPVFIIGMPRSGTTLVEQIIASHPRVHGADELTKIQECTDRLAAELGSERPYPECIADIDAATIARLADEYLAHLRTHSASALRVTDKMPANFWHLGLIALLFPHARVVHCRRDARDVCVSNYFQQYGQGQHYTYKLADLGLYYNSYRSLMRHWRAVLPLQMYEIDYERLVGDQEAESRALVEHCGLEWDERCLEFHKTQRTVFTASHWQVRQPMYRRSSRRWKNYEAHLGTLLEVLEVDEP